MIVNLVNGGADSLESLGEVFTIKVEYYRSLEYSVKWTDPMKPKGKSKRPKTSKSKNDLCGEDAVLRRTRGKWRQEERDKAQSVSAKVQLDEPSTNDIIDIIDRGGEDEPEEWGTLVEVDDKGLDQFDEDQVSVTSSVKSGPSFPEKLSLEKPLSLCPSCRKLYQTAKRRKTPLKDKMLDTNPKSLTCDQWILLKPWRSKTTADCGGSLSQLIHKLVKSSRNRTKLVRKVCSRPHLFLERNLQRCIRKPVKKEKRKNRRKRAREDSQGPRIAKQQRLPNNQHRPIIDDFSHENGIEPIANNFTHNGPDPKSSRCSTSSLESQEDSDLTLTQPPVSVTSDTNSSKLCPKQSAPKRGGFRDLLAQLRGNNSMIIRESTTEVTPK